MDALTIPPAALRDNGSIEIARIWIAERGLHCSLKFGLYADEGIARETSAWGIILADLAGHVADALGADGMGVKAELLRAIVESFNEEVLAPTSERSVGPSPKVN
jgi:hypothetical protein